MLEDAVRVEVGSSVVAVSGCQDNGDPSEKVDHEARPPLTASGVRSEQRVMRRRYPECLVRNAGSAFAPRRLGVTGADETEPNPSTGRSQRKTLAARLRRETLEFGWGAFQLLDSGDEAVMAHRCDSSRNAVVAVHNFSDTTRSVTISLDEPYETIEDLLRAEDPPEGDPLQFDLEAFGFRWFRIRHEQR